MGIFHKKEKEGKPKGGRERAASTPNTPSGRSDDVGHEIRSPVSLTDESIKTPVISQAQEKPSREEETKNNRKANDKKASKKEDVIDIPKIKKSASHSNIDMQIVQRPTNRCCCLFHMPTSITLMIVLLLGNDIWFAWHSMNQANQATKLYEDMKSTWQQQGTMAAVRRAHDLQVLFDVNVIVACIDIVFTLVGLAGVDTESFWCFLVFNIWKFLQFGYSVSSSIVTLTLMQYYQSDKSTTAIKDILTWENGGSLFGLVLELYFLVFMIVYLNYLRKLRRSYLKVHD